MIITAQELAVIKIALDLSTDEITYEGQVYYKPRTYTTIAEQRVALSVYNKVADSTKEEDGAKILIESEIEFSTEEKKLVLDLIERPFTITDLQYKLSLFDKLS